MHKQIISSTNNYILKDGKTDYSVVVANNCRENEKFAAEEFVKYFYQSTSVKLSVINENDAVYNDNSRYICIGNLFLPQQEKANANYDNFALEDYIIKTSGLSVFVNGGNRGIIYGVYELLKNLINLNFYTNIYYDINENLTEVLLPNFDVYETPDFRCRPLGYPKILGADKTKLELRISPDAAVIGTVGHNCMEVINIEKYCNPEDPENYHPEFYLLTKKASDAEKHENYELDKIDKGRPLQLCYHANGNEESRKKMVDIAFEFYKEKLIADPDPDHFILTLAAKDGYHVCRCETCTRELEKYNGSDAAAVIKFLNDVYAKLEQWFATAEGKKYGKRGVVIRFYAYASLRKAPVIYDELSNTFTPIDNSIICRKGVVPFVACIEADHTIPLNDSNSIRNKEHYLNLKSWASIAEKIQIYEYADITHSYLAPFNTVDAIRENYKMGKRYNTELFYYLGQMRQTGSVTGWDSLKIYLLTNMAWNVDADQNELTDKFFEGCYKDAAVHMREWYEDYLSHFKYIQKAFGTEYSYNELHTDAVLSQYWPKEKLVYWIDCLDRANKSILHLKDTNPKLYEKIEKNIAIESVSLWYLFLTIYPLELTINCRVLIKYQAMKNKKLEFKALTERLGIKYFGEGAEETLDALWTLWGIA